MIKKQELLKKTLISALLVVNFSNGFNNLNDLFSNEKTVQVARYLHEQLIDEGPYLVNGVSINPSDEQSVFEGMDELYKIFSIAITFKYPNYIAKEANTEKYQLGPLGLLEKDLSDFETFYKDIDVLENGAKIAVILVLNPIDPLKLKELKEILRQNSFVYAFSAGAKERPYFERGNYGS